MSVFSERLTEARKAMGWTRKRAVSEIGIPYQTYSNYEQGKREPDINTISAISTLFNTSNDYLMGKTDNPEPKSSDLSSTDLADMLDNVRSYDGKTFDEHDKELLTTFLKGLYADK